MRLDKRLQELEKKINPEGPTEILFCWCARDDGLRDTDCACYGKKFDKVINLDWGDVESGNGYL